MPRDVLYSNGSVTVRRAHGFPVGCSIRKPRRVLAEIRIGSTWRCTDGATTVRVLAAWRYRRDGCDPIRDRVALDTVEASDVQWEITHGDGCVEIRQDRIGAVRHGISFLDLSFEGGVLPYLDVEV